jgi:hypothetical protein
VRGKREPLDVYAIQAAPDVRRINTLRTPVKEPAEVPG